MELITERTMLLGVAKRWANAYPKSGPYGRDKNKQEIGKSLAALDTGTATAADVAAIIGNGSWCRPPTCDECGAIVDAVVLMGEPSDYESATAKICMACLSAALELMRPSAQVEAAQTAATKG